MRAKRGKESWNYIYIILGFTLTIEGVLVGYSPLYWYWNLAIAFVLLSGTTALFLLSGWFQNKLIGLKNRYESKWR